MSKVLPFEKRLFYWCNKAIHAPILDRLFEVLTHLGGAIFTITFTLGFALFAPNTLSRIGWQSLIALTVSHLIVALIKRKFRRIRPFLALSEVKTGKKILLDASFPSGHTTAIFSVITPFLFLSAWLAVILLPLALLVSFSRIYLGLHYPTDCLAGCVLGVSTAICTLPIIA
ncbi:phosphatase PAP2 family protein [Paenibacillus sp. N1-5-1-14]|uniref:phosphatase PAP2 family protein n=1 Tax=Paenibacillus radicibacter TaxID=2972488 RepID=UPI002158E861|nr:phosphatase PAP2 family protein [Paenibacillus radicibacter]MCR8644863.1 phosphatase PAP2 family protein [Paenibacillus radicibacter]